MTEEQAERIIELLEKIVLQTESLETPYTMSDICTRLVYIESAIGRLEKN
ncbi:hypothetical protein [Flavobacterium alkalisoli]|nr:hypothetical protein [Flavobacterium alkalisoli]